VERLQAERKEMAGAQEAFEAQQRELKAAKAELIKHARMLKDVDSTAQQKEAENQQRMRLLSEKEALLAAKEKELAQKQASAPRAAPAPPAPRRPPGPQLEAIPMQNAPQPPRRPESPEDYVSRVPTSSTRELASVAIFSGQNRIEGMRSQGIHPGQAEEYLKQAGAVFNAGDFSLARDLAGKAEAQIRDIVQLHNRASMLLEEIQRTHPTLISAGALAPEKGDAAERSRKAFETGDYATAVELGEMALATERLAGGMGAAPAAATRPPAVSVVGKLPKRLCPVCNRVFALPLTAGVTRVKCPWCGSPVQVGQ